MKTKTKTTVGIGTCLKNVVSNGIIEEPLKYDFLMAIYPVN